MLGSKLDNIHPYGIRVAIGADDASPAVKRAAERAARKADKLLAEIIESGASTTRRSSRSRAS